MRKILALCCIILLFAGCVDVVNAQSALDRIKQMRESKKTEEIKIYNVTQNINEELCINTGQIFFREETILGEIVTAKTSNNFDFIKFYGVAGYFELIISSVSKNKLTLDYSEYILNINDQFSYRIVDGDKIIVNYWMKRIAFDKSFEYDISESKTICFKTYQFEITKIKNGSIFYIRKK